MLTSTVSTASVVAKSLEELSHHVGIEVLLLNIDESTFLVKDNMECKWLDKGSFILERKRKWRRFWLVHKESNLMFGFVYI